ncbi:MAG: hypothetical protein CMN77_10940 [Spirochaetaceae bacterium]|nr:hypothetical protein [Spirochaetaceae bacterium]
MVWYLTAMKSYASFSGRARRREYWFFQLFYGVFLILVMAVDSVLSATVEGFPMMSILGAFLLLHFLPSLGVSVRRLHDVGRSGWMLLIGLVPVLGAVVLLVLTVGDSVPSSNQYGPNPKEIGDPASPN